MSDDELIQGQPDFSGRSLPELVGLLGSHAGIEKEAAGRAILSLRGRPAVEALAELLESEDAAVRSQAIELLEEIGIDAPDVLIQVLSTGSDDAQIFALDIVGSLKLAQCVEDIAGALESSNVNVRNACAMALSQIATAECIPYLLRCLEDDEWVRFSAIEGLCRIGDPQVVAQLVEKLQQSRDEAFYPGILASFVELRDKRTFLPLLDELSVSTPEFHSEIVAALMELIDLDQVSDHLPEETVKRALPSLRALLKHDDPWTAFRAVNVLGRVAGRTEIDVIIDTMVNGPDLAQAGAVRALEMSATSEDLPALRMALPQAGIMIQDEVESLIRRLEAGSGEHPSGDSP